MPSCRYTNRSYVRSTIGPKHKWLHSNSRSVEALALARGANESASERCVQAGDLVPLMSTWQWKGKAAAKAAGQTAVKEPERSSC